MFYHEVTEYIHLHFKAFNVKRKVGGKVMSIKFVKQPTFIVNEGYEGIMNNRFHYPDWAQHTVIRQTYIQFSPPNVMKKSYEQIAQFAIADTHATLAHYTH